MIQHTPKSCGECEHGYHPSIGAIRIDSGATICSLIGGDAIYDSDKLNPDCPLAEKSRKGTTKADMVKELTSLRQDKMDLLKALERIASMEEPVPEYPLKTFSNPFSNMAQHHKSIAVAAIAKVK